MDISAGLKLSIMGGLFQLEGSGKFFKDTKKSAKSAKASVINSISTEYQKISITDNSLQSIINFNVLEEIDATHVVVGIQWGGYVFVSVEDMDSEDKDQLIVQGNLKAKLTALAGKISADGKARVNINDGEKSELDKFNFEIFGDILPDAAPQNLIDALNFMKSATIALQSANNGKGKAMKYTLIPISVLRKVMKFQTKIDSIINQVDETTVQKCVKLFDDMNKNEQKINDLVDSVNLFDKYLLTSKIDELSKLQFDYRIYQAQIQKLLSDNLILVRSGKETTEKLMNIIVQAEEHPYSWLNIEAKFKKLSTEFRQEISFLQYLMNMKVNILDKDKNLEMFLHNYSKNNVFILCYSEPNSRIIGKPLEVMIELIDITKKSGTTDKFAAINCAIFNLGSESKLMYYQNMKLIAENFDNNSKIYESNKIESTLISSMQNRAIPIGFIYTQLPREKQPEDIWPSFKWQELTKEYSDLFFRVEGPNSRPFGEIQKSDQNWISDINVLGYQFDSRGKHNYTRSFNQTNWIDAFGEGLRWPLAISTLYFNVKLGEVRPKNTAIKLWKRIQ